MTNVSGLKLQAPSKVSKDELANVKGILKEIEASRPAPQANDVALDELADQLLSMRSKGFSLDELVSVLTDLGISVTSSKLDSHLRKAMLAKMNMYEAKLEELGRRGQIGSTERFAFIQRGLRRALDTGVGLMLHYQPQVDMRTGIVVGAEALLRWRDGTTLVSPTEFIPVAEVTGLIDEIGTWVMREACTEAARWHKRGLCKSSGLRVSVNLSVKQCSGSLVDVLHGVLCDTGLKTALLGVEITESFLAEDRTQHLLQLLHDTGIHLSIDDFGTGYSCLSSVLSLPLDTIKIDRAFVAGLGETESAEVMVQTIISMAQRLGMSTIAEGVETKLQAETLMKLGCTVAQGFFYAKPMPAADFEQFALAAYSG